VHGAVFAMAIGIWGGCTPGGERDPVPAALSLEGALLVVRDDGTVDVLDEDMRPVLLRGFGAVTLDALYEDGRVLRTDADRERQIATWSETDAHGNVDWAEVLVIGEDDEPDLRWTISAAPEGGFFSFEIAVDNGTGGPIDVAKTAPLQVQGRDQGGLWLGVDPGRHRILENGSFTALDFVAEVLPGDVPFNDGFATIAPGDFAGHAVSNWNHAVVDLDGEAVWVAGALTFAASMPVINLSYVPAHSVTAPDGRQGFSYLSAESAYLPAPKPVAAGATFSSEKYAIFPAEDDALLGLERYADAVGAELDTVPWHRREAGRRVPNGWNSWSASGSTGGYGTNIDEALILANLDIMATELRDWGMDWFQVDDGYQPYYGDWWFLPGRFPHGPTWLADEIRARGFRPGLWMAPFTLNPDSATARAHPDWLADKSLLGALVVGDQEILDLTHPEVKAYLHDLFHTFREEWGFEWLKLDFGYYALFGDNLYDPTLTREEAWRGALSIIREEMGEESFFIIVGSLGIDYDLADAGRTTQDNMPVWDWTPGLGFDDRLEQQGFKPTVRTAGRRWYLQDRVWVNHPDLIVFRSNTRDPTWPRVTFEESRAFASFVGLSGGIVKIGDRLVDLDGPALDTLRRLLPIYGHPARPLDVFEREFPEVWHLDVDAPLDGHDEAWEVIGLFHWGSNLDLRTWPYAEIIDDGRPRTHRVDLDQHGMAGDWLAYEFWTGAFLGPVSETLVVRVPSHDSRVVALRRPTGVPQLLGWNRQITMGGTLLEEASWDEEAAELTVRTPVVPGTEKAPFTWEIVFHVPEDFTRSEVAFTGAAVEGVEVLEEDRVLRVRFEALEAGDLTLVISF